jgi:HEAT repeat protein
MATNELLKLLTEINSADPVIRKRAVEDVGALGERDLDAVRLLISVLLNDQEDEIRAYAAGSLGLLSHPFSVEPLMNALKDEFWRVRLTAIWALRELGAKKAIPELMRLCKDTNASVRAIAAQKLGEFHAAEAIEILIQLLEDSEKDVQGSAIFALWGFSDARALQPLKRLMKSYENKDGRDSSGNDIVAQAKSAIDEIQHKQKGGA